MWPLQCQQLGSAGLKSYIRLMDMASEHFDGVPSALSHAVTRRGVADPEEPGCHVRKYTGGAMTCDVMDEPDVGQHSKTSANGSMEMQLH